MNKRRFIASTERLAMKTVYEELGSDVKILLNRKTSDGVEIVASAHTKPQHAVRLRKKLKAKFNKLRAKQLLNKMPEGKAQAKRWVQQLVERNLEVVTLMLMTSALKAVSMR